MSDLKEYLKKQKRGTINNLIHGGYLYSPEVKKAMMTVERELFVLSGRVWDAWVDEPLPIVGEATISAPHMYAIMLEKAKLRGGERVLEIGSGSGYGAALIRELVGKEGKVITIEIYPRVYEFAKRNLEKAGYTDVEIILGDGSIGYEKEAPYDCILVTADSFVIPEPLIEQLKPSGRMLAPERGILSYLKNNQGRLEIETICRVSFVPLRGKYGREESDCFIATAAYGTPFTQEINVLRKWRDKSLKTNPVGRALVNIYYKSSPPIAGSIRDSEGLRKVVRTILLPAVNFLRKY